MDWYRRLWPIWLFFVYFIVALTIHHSGFNAPFYYDSANRLSQNEKYFAQGLTETVNIFRQRPVPMVSFYLNYMAAGMTPRPFRICNAAFLAAASVTIVALIVLLLEISSADAGIDRVQDRRVAVALSLIFLVHPVQTYVVVYVWQRMALLACLFSLASLTAYLAARSGRIARRSVYKYPLPNPLREGEGDSGPGGSTNVKPIANRSTNTVLGYTCSAFFFLLGLASKENAVAMPVVLILAEIAFFQNTWRGLVVRSALILGVALAFVSLLSFLESPHGLQESSGIVATLSRYYRESGLTVTEVALTQCRVLFSYLEMILAPLPSVVRLFNPQIISRSLLVPPITLPAFVGTVALVIGGVCMVRRRPLTGFGLLFFLVNLLPESVLVPQYQFFGYRVVLPMVGLLLVIADLAVPIMSKVRTSSQRVPMTAGLLGAYAAVILLMASSTVSKAALWTDPIAFWRAVVDRLPQDPRQGDHFAAEQALISLGMCLLQKGKPSEAGELFRRLLATDPKSFSALVGLGNAYTALGNMDNAESCFRRALEIDPKSSDVHVAMGRLFLGKGRLQDAVPQFEQALELNRDNPTAHYELGRILVTKGSLRDAVSHFRKAVESYPRYHEAHYALGKVLLKLDDHRSALDSFLKTVEIKPDHWESHNDIGAIWGKMGKPDKAVTHFRKSLKINPEYGPTKRNLEAALQQLNHQDTKTPRKAEE